MKRILAYLTATLAMFVWGFVFWGLSADAIGLYQKPADDAALGKVLNDNLGADGVYFVPAEVTDQAAWTALHKSGPLAMVHFRRAGTDPMAPTVFVGGFLHMLVTTLLIGCLLSAVDRGRRFKVLCWGALAAAVFANLGQPIWFYQSWCYHGLVAGYQFLAWLLAGTILIKMLPERS